MQGVQADSSCSLPAEPPFEAYPAVMGAATVGMLVATVASFLAVRCVARHRDALPRECWGQGGLSGGHGQTPGAHTSHPSVPRAARPALPHVSAPTPLAQCSHTPALVRDPYLPSPRAGPGAQEPIGMPEDAETAASREDGAAPAPEDPSAPGAAAGNSTHGVRQRLSHPPQWPSTHPASPEAVPPLAEPLSAPPDTTDDQPVNVTITVTATP